MTPYNQAPEAKAEPPQFGIDIHDEKIDQLEFLARSSSHSIPWCREEIAARHLLIGAARLGADSMKWTHGWWQRKRVARPITLDRHLQTCPRTGDDFHKLSGDVLNRPCRCTPETLREEAIILFSKTYGERMAPFVNCGWQIVAIASLPRWHIVHPRDRVERVSDKQTMIVLRNEVAPQDQLHAQADRLYAKSLDTIRHAVETYTGHRRIVRRQDVLESMRGMPEHWARACYALANIPEGSWFDGD